MRAKTELNLEAVVYVIVRCNPVVHGQQERRIKQYECLEGIINAISSYQGNPNSSSITD